MNVHRALVSPGYFGVMRIPLLAGRDFRESDNPQAPPVMIVNQEFARRYFRAETVVGRRVGVLGKLVTVIGLAHDSKYFSPAESPQPHFYLAFGQSQRRLLHELNFFIRTAGEPKKAIPLLRRAVAATDSGASASFHTAPLSEYTQIAVFPQRVAASLMSSLGAMCLFLAALGLYSVMSFAVNQRAQEIGIRMAMGARPSEVIGMVVREGMLLALAGLAAGVPRGVGRHATDREHAGSRERVGYPRLSRLAPAVFLGLVALVATWLPARRATRIDPMLALRQQ